MSAQSDHLLQEVFQRMPSFSAMGVRSPRPRTVVVLIGVSLLLLLWGTRRRGGLTSSSSLHTPTTSTPTARSKLSNGLLPDYEAADMKSIQQQPLRRPSRRRSNRIRQLNTSVSVEDQFYYLRPVKVKKGKSYRAQEVFPSTIESQEKFTMIMQTYNRTDLLMKLLNHYNGVKHLDRILVVWNNINQTPPIEFWDKLVPHSVEVLFLVQKTNLMRNRLQAFPEIRTEGMYMHNGETIVTKNLIETPFFAIAE